ncbi:hypothetical protein V8C44DRAFT_74378 [Trichoderma aethiopicum]
MNPLHLPRRAPSSSSRQANYSPCLMDLVDSGLGRESWKGHRNPKLVAETGAAYRYYPGSANISTAPA